jgi:hypothetical protein
MDLTKFEFTTSKKKKTDDEKKKEKTKWNKEGEKLAGKPFSDYELICEIQCTS